jgi:hypothetical protein
VIDSALDSRVFFRWLWSSFHDRVETKHSFRWLSSDNCSESSSVVSSHSWLESVVSSSSSLKDTSFNRFPANLCSSDSEIFCCWINQTSRVHLLFEYEFISIFQLEFILFLLAMSDSPASGSHNSSSEFISLFAHIYVEWLEICMICKYLSERVEDEHSSSGINLSFTVNHEFYAAVWQIFNGSETWIPSWLKIVDTDDSLQRFKVYKDGFVIERWKDWISESIIDDRIDLKNFISNWYLFSACVYKMHEWHTK